MNANVEEILLKYNKIYIAGAQSRAKVMTGYIAELFPEVSIEAYLVERKEENDDAIEGRPVYQMHENCHLLDVNIPVFIATKGIFHAELQENLQDLGFRLILFVTPEMDNWFRNSYVRKIFNRDNRSFIKLEELKWKETSRSLDACIYMAQSIFDSPLKMQYKCPAYEKPIQVGAVFSSSGLGDNVLKDCEGDNISAKNRQYCELTGLYWIWKHAGNDIIGLSHYRRHFVLPEHWLDLMETNDIDVVLPVPAYIAPSIEENYKERHDASDWEYLMEYLKEHNPSDYDLGQQVFAGNLYLTCNMFIARREVLNQLCEWLFPILDAVVLHSGEKEDVYKNRYPGFVSERLITLFFEKHKDKYKIVYADKIFIS